MALRLKSTKSKYSESFSIIDDYIHPETNKRSTFVVEALGSLTTLMEKYQTNSRDEVIKHLKNYINEQKQLQKEENGTLTFEFIQSELIEKDTVRFFNAGYLYIKNILCPIELKRICNEIQERYTIENALYQKSGKKYPRNTNILYYDCTNLYFETEEVDNFRLYGYSDKHRPKPIVQYGLFMDADGILLADYPFAGNKNEQPTLRALEQKIE